MGDLVMDSGTAAAVRTTVRRYATLFLVQAGLLIVVGIAALFSPLVTTLALTYLLGWVLIVGGVVQGISLVAARDVPHFWMQLASAVVSIVTGIIFVRHTGIAATSLALLLIIYFMVEGVAKVVFALTVRPLPNWGWVLLSGVVGIGLSVFLILNPLLSFLALGIFIGIQFILEGIAIGWIAWQARKV